MNVATEYTDLSDNEVVHPVARSAQGNTIRSVRERPDLGDDNPGAWTPTVSEMDDEQPDHGNCSPTGTLVCSPRVLVLGNNNSNDDVAGCHTDSTNGEHGSATNFVYVQDRGDGGNEHSNTDDSSGKQVSSVSGKAKVGEDGRRIVQDSVDTCSRLDVSSNYSSYTYRSIAGRT